MQGAILHKKAVYYRGGYYALGEQFPFEKDIPVFGIFGIDGNQGLCRSGLNLNNWDSLENRSKGYLINDFSVLGRLSVYRHSISHELDNFSIIHMCSSNNDLPHDFFIHF